METEIWKDIEGYEGLYQVSNLGRVRSLDRTMVQTDGHVRFFKGQIIKPVTNSNKKLNQENWYLKVNLHKTGKMKGHFIHRLVGKAFIKNDEPEIKTQINHLNENKQDNRADNLEWITPSDNVNYGTRNKQNANKISKPVYQIDLTGNVVKKWYSTTEAIKEYGGGVSKCVLGKIKTAYGYKWERTI